VNAAGQDIPPFVIVKGMTDKSLNAFNVALGTYQKKAWMEDYGLISHTELSILSVLTIS
jgi:hypothetical protein